jgi:hypothetical protein
MSATVSSELRLLPMLIAPSAPGPHAQPKRDRRDEQRADRRLDARRFELEPAALLGKDRRDRDRRATGRVEVALDCVERLGTQRFFRITHDLSTFGLSTATGPAHRMGTRLQLALQLPDGNAEPVFVEAEVVGVNSENQGMRLAFRNPSADALKRIHKFVQATAS